MALEFCCPRNTANDAVYGVVALELDGRLGRAVVAAAIVGHHLGRARIVHLHVRLAVGHVCGCVEAKGDKSEKRVSGISQQ